MAHRKNRNRKPSNTAPIPPRPESGPEAARRIIHNLPLPGDVTFVPNIHVGTAAAESTPPPAADGENGQPQARRESRANSVRLGLRSKLLFPLEMKELIDKLADDYSRQTKASTSLESWLAFEMARSTVQSDEANDQLLINKVRVIERAGTAFDDDCGERVQRLSLKLPAEPCRVQKALAATKHGALYLVDKLTLLGDAADSNGSLDDMQISTLYDLMGIDPVYRNGCRRVPPASDGRAVRKTIDGEIARHNLSLERTLNARSDCEKRMAQLGLARFNDTISRGLRSDLNRARKRYSWALESLRELQRGADPAGLLDPDTGAPIAVGPPASAVPEPRRPAAPPQPPPPPQPEPEPAPVSPPSPPVTPLPAGYSDEAKELYWVAAGTVLNESATPAGDEPGPPPEAA